MNIKIKNELIRICEENGVDPSDDQQLINVDSIQYISIIVEIEQFFEIVLPDDLLSENGLVDFDCFVSTVRNIYEGSQNNAMLPTENILDTNFTNNTHKEDLL